MQIILMGVRGSIPVSGEEYQEFGGATSSVLIIPENNKKHIVVIDAGTGIMNLSKYIPKETENISILLSHVHVDHIIGLTMSPIMFDGAIKVNVMGERLDNLGIREQIALLMRPPLWPVTPAVYPEKVTFCDLPEKEFSLGELKIEKICVKHPSGGSRAFIIKENDKTFVYANDCELFEFEDTEILQQKAENCDLLLIDGMYDRRKIESCRGFGHSSWNESVAFAEKCNAKQTRIVHHYPLNNDQLLNKAELEIRGIIKSVAFGREGETIKV